MIKKLKILCRGHLLLLVLTEKTVGTFYKKELQKSNKKELIIEKVIKRKGDKL